VGILKVHQRILKRNIGLCVNGIMIAHLNLTWCGCKLHDCNLHKGKQQTFSTTAPQITINKKEEATQSMHATWEGPTELSIHTRCFHKTMNAFYFLNKLIQ
jgi:hypothetical protein